MREITLNSPLDMHLHLRDGEMLNLVAPLSAKFFSSALVMPNLVPPLTDIQSLLEYKKRIKKACKDERFEPLMSLFFKAFDGKFLEQAKPHISAIKLYPAGITTNSSSGVSSMDAEKLRPTLECMSKLNIPLCIHGETNGFVMDREAEFASIYEDLAKKFPKLKIIMEHISTKSSANLLDRYENLYASITLHHLLLSLDDVIGGMLEVHHFCKPIPKRYEDRDALLELALSGHKKVIFGSDSAPHPVSKKECCGCAAGVFSAPVALPVLCELFEKHKCLENLQAFVSDNAQAIYDFKPLEKNITLIKSSMEVPTSYGDVVPLFAGKSIRWNYKT